MQALRWILFIPGGLLLGIAFAIPFTFLYSIWNLDNIFFMSVVKNGFYFYYMALCMAWIAPSTFNYSGFRTFISILFGVMVAISARALLVERDELWFWELAGEVTGLALGYMGATVWDKNSVPALLANMKGVCPFNAYDKKPLTSEG